METLLKRRRLILRSKHYDNARKKLRLAVNYLYREGATEVHLFGSITHPERFTEHSDIDLAVKGIPEEKRLEVEGKLEDIFNDMKYDILFLEEAKDIRKEILQKIEEEAVEWRP